MRNVILIVTTILSGCAGSLSGLYEYAVLSPTVDPASIRSAAQYDRDRAECRSIVNQSRQFGQGIEQDAVVYRRCLAGRGYSVLQ